MRVELDKFDNSTFVRGRSALTELLWMIVEIVLVRSAVPGSSHRRLLLQLFGARVARGVVIKPGVHVKFPWRLEVGANSWIGENVWIDNLAEVRIGANCCISQDAYLCTGSHDWTKARFDLVVRPIVIENEAWVAARATLAPGTVMGEGAVLGLGSVASGRLDPWGIYRGNPACLVGCRVVESATAPA